MPENFDATITVLKGDITNFLKKARLFADKLNKIAMQIQDEKNLSLTLSNETVGTTKNTIPAVIQGNIETVPPFNYKFIQDALSVILDDRITLSIVNDKTKPMMIRGAEETACTAIVSPLLDK